MNVCFHDLLESKAVDPAIRSMTRIIYSDISLDTSGIITPRFTSRVCYSWWTLWSLPFLTVVYTSNMKLENSDTIHTGTNTVSYNDRITLTHFNTEILHQVSSPELEQTTFFSQQVTAFLLFFYVILSLNIKPKTRGRFRFKMTFVEQRIFLMAGNNMGFEKIRWCKGSRFGGEKNYYWKWKIACQKICMAFSLISGNILIAIIASRSFLLLLIIFMHVSSAILTF